MLDLGLLGEGEADVDFDGGFAFGGDELPLVNGVLGGAREDVVAADDLGGGDGAIGGHGGCDFDDAADYHSLCQFGVDGCDALLDGAFGGRVQGKGAGEGERE